MLGEGYFPFGETQEGAGDERLNPVTNQVTAMLQWGGKESSSGVCEGLEMTIRRIDMVRESAHDCLALGLINVQDSSGGSRG